MAWWRKLLGFEETKAGAPSRDPAPDNPWQAAAAAPAPSDDYFDGFHTTKRKRGQHTAWVWLRTIAVGLIVLSGVNQLVIKPVRALLTDETPQKAPSVQVDTAAASSVAAGFTLDYLTYGGSAWEPHRAAALGKWLDERVFSDPSSVGTWSGDAVLIPSSPIIDGTHAVGERSAVVAVRVQVSSFVPSDGTATTAEVPAPPSAADAAYVPQIPANYEPGPAYWVRLVVPITTQPSGAVVVAGPGPAFTGDALEPVEVGEDIDTRAAEKVSVSVKKILPAYATGDLQYIAAPGSSLKGMGGALTFQAANGVNVVAGDDKSPRSASMTVTWELAGTGTTIEQIYGVVLANLDSQAPVLQRISVLTPIEPRTD